MPFLLNEDRALKERLKGLTVSDAKSSSRAVGVWYGQPDVEIRAQSYPYMTIDLVGIAEDFTRSMRGIVGELPYTPEGLDLDVSYKNVEFPIPVSIDYQITTYARNPQHDRQIIAGLLNGILPFRFAVLEVPEDGTLRRLDLLGYTKRDRNDEDGKRTYINVLSVRVSSELFPTQIEAATPDITSTNTDLHTI